MGMEGGKKVPLSPDKRASWTWMLVFGALHGSVE